jgi:hypothetical protein
MVGLIDGPVAVSHSALAGNKIREVPGEARGACTQAASAACLHGTFVAGILSAKRGSSAPAICPDCTLLVRPVFSETELGDLEQPSAEPGELAAAILACIEARARVINLSLALMRSSAQAKLTLLGGARPRRPAGRAHCRRRGKSRHYRQHGHHRPPVGNSCRRLRLERQAA